MAWERGFWSDTKDFHGGIYEEERAMGDLQGIIEGVLYMKVMTDEQIEILRWQISIYATICEQLVAMYNAFTSQQETLAGMKVGAISFNPSEVPKITTRQRWIPTSRQLQILEDIFKQGNGTPTKQRIAEIASELAKHGHVSDAKVYNWFQNKRARAKKKQAAHLKSSADPESSEAEIESSSSKKIKIDEIHEKENLLPIELPSRIEDEPSSNDVARALCTQEKMPYYENAASHSGLWSHSFPSV